VTCWRMLLVTSRSLPVSVLAAQIHPTARLVTSKARCARWVAGGQLSRRAGLYDLLVSTRLETARLVIRTFEARDAGPWLAMVTDPEVRRFLPPGPDPTMEDFQRVIGERQAMEGELGHAMWAVEDKATGTFVGQCGLRPVDEGAGPEIDLAYHFIRACWNKGYGTEAAIAVLAHGLGPVGLDCIMAVCRAGECRLVAGHGEGGHALCGACRLLRDGSPEEVHRGAGMVAATTRLITICDSGDQSAARVAADMDPSCGRVWGAW
jgi:ribosomal-protein-alanine N-acetyltransferase